MNGPRNDLVIGPTIIKFEIPIDQPKFVNEKKQNILSQAEIK